MTKKTLLRAAALSLLVALSTSMFAEDRRRQQRGWRDRGMPPRTQQGIRQVYDLEYARVGSTSLRLDLHLPEKGEGPLPVIVWIHGGGWSNGSKKQCRPAVPFATEGYAVACIDYRLSDVATFPAPIEDCKGAVRWLRANAATYGLDPQRFAVWGSSAGGHLATLLGTSGNVVELEGSVGGNLEQSSAVQAVCDYYGPAEFSALARNSGPRRGKRKPAVEGLLGGPVSENQALARLASPITHITPEDPPFLIVHGSEDRVVAPRQSQLLYDALTQAGVEADLHVINGAGHGGPEFVAAEIRDMVGRFFATHLGSSMEATTSTTSTTARPRSNSGEPTVSGAHPGSETGGASGGLLFFATYRERDNTAPIANPHIAGALFTLYWSEIEPEKGRFDWSELEGRIKPWVEAGKKVALRIMWSSNGKWANPTARRPTPHWVLASGARVVVSEQTGTEVPLVWDPIYREHAGAFLKAVGRKFDGHPEVLFIDVTPGAETNPYRLGLDRVEPDLRARFKSTPASDGRTYSDRLWLETVIQFVDMAASAFDDTRLLITLNVAALDSPSPMRDIGDYSVAKGWLVGQNGLKGGSYIEDTPRRSAFLKWGERSMTYFEMAHRSGRSTGSLLQIMQAAERVGADYLGVYPADVLLGTSGNADFSLERSAALEYGAAVTMSGH